MQKYIHYILLSLLLLFTSCELKLKPNEDEEDASRIKVERYDRLQSRYLLTGDFSALQQMNTDYPIETRTLVEKMLQIGEVSDHDINERFLRFYQDSTLQTLISDCESEFANMDDINRELVASFTKLKEWLPELPLPRIYAQIGAFDQSVVVGERMVGISLDKYMGARYQLYQRFNYSAEQLSTMNRGYIVPDVLSFYLLSCYPLENFENRTQQERDLCIAKVMWVVNKALGRKVLAINGIDTIESYMSRHKDVTISQLMETNDYQSLTK